MAGAGREIDFKEARALTWRGAAVISARGFLSIRQNRAVEVLGGTRPMVEEARRRWSVLREAQWISTVPLLVIQFASGIWYMPQTSFFPIYLQEQLGLAPVAISALVAASQAAGMVAGVVGGVLSDAFGGKRVLVLGLFGASLAGVAFLTTVPWLVALLWAIGGLAIGFHTLGGSSYLTKVADRRHVGLLAAFYALTLTLGGALGSPAAGLILDARGFGAFGGLVLGLAGLTTLLTGLLLPGVKADQARERMPWRESWAGAGGMVRRPIPVLLLLLRFLPTIYYGMAGVLIPLMINDIAGRKTTVAIYGTASLIAASTAQLVAGRSADRFGRQWPMLIGFATVIVSATGLALFSKHLWGIFLFGLLGNGAAWALAGLMFCLVSDSLPVDEHGRMLGLLHGVWSIGMIAGAMTGGALTRLAREVPFLVAAGLNVLSVFLALRFFALSVPHTGRLTDSP